MEGKAEGRVAAGTGMEGAGSAAKGRKREGAKTGGGTGRETGTALNPRATPEPPGNCLPRSDRKQRRRRRHRRSPEDRRKRRRNRRRERGKRSKEARWRSRGSL